MTGIIVVDKPGGYTSFDVVAKLRGMLGTKKIGHGGTLDPLATGVLPVFVGAATRAVDLSPRQDKRYIAKVATGMQTDSGDVTGDITLSGAQPTRSEILRVLPQFVGRQKQTPPMYSAVRVNGKHLYELARSGQQAAREAREIEIYSIDLLDFDDNGFIIDVRCRKGAYIRTLAEDICRAAGGCGTISALRRSESGGFTLADSQTLDDLQQLKNENKLESALLPTDTVFADWRRVDADAHAGRLLDNGVTLRAEQLADVAPQEGEKLRAYRDGRFFAILQCVDGTVKKIATFRDEG